MAGDVETYFEDGAWHNWDQAARAEVGAAHTDRDAAVAEGRELARERDVEHVVRDQEATIVEREEYGEETPTAALRAQERAGFESRHGAADPGEQLDPADRPPG